MMSDPSYYTVSVASSEQFITKTVAANRPPVAIAIGSVDGHPRLFRRDHGRSDGHVWSPTDMLAAPEQLQLQLIC